MLWDSPVNRVINRCKFYWESQFFASVFLEIFPLIREKCYVGKLNLFHPFFCVSRELDLGHDRTSSTSSTWFLKYFPAKALDIKARLGLFFLTWRARCWRRFCCCVHRVNNTRVTIVSQTVFMALQLLSGCRHRRKDKPQACATTPKRRRPEEKREVRPAARSEGTIHRPSINENLPP